MTTGYRHEMKCPCGHRGNIKILEYDFDFGSEPDIFDVEGLEGNRVQETPTVYKMQDVVDLVKPTCPNCKRRLELEHLVDKRGKGMG